MGRLAGFSYREVARKLRALGFSFDRPGPGSHEILKPSGANGSPTGSALTYDAQSSGAVILAAAAEASGLPRPNGFRKKSALRG